MSESRNPKQIAASLTELWSPKVIGQVDDSFVKVAKVKGQLTWHSHENEDELFMILAGQLKIEMRDQTVVLNEGDVYVVPRGVEHNPIAEDECLLMLFEKKSTQHTGDVVTDKTRSIDEQLVQE